MSEISWNPYCMVFYDILLDYCVPCALADRLFVGQLIYLSLRNKPIVAWDVRGHLGCSHCELIILVSLLGSFKRQVVPWVVSVFAYRVTKLCHIITSG